jgi:hypothetical protein
MSRLARPHPDSQRIPLSRLLHSGRSVVPVVLSPGGLCSSPRSSPVRFSPCTAPPAAVAGGACGAGAVCVFLSASRPPAHHSSIIQPSTTSLNPCASLVVDPSPRFNRRRPRTQTRNTNTRFRSWQASHGLDNQKATPSSSSPPVSHPAHDAASANQAEPPAPIRRKPSSLGHRNFRSVAERHTTTLLIAIPNITKRTTFDVYTLQRRHIHAHITIFYRPTS